MLWVSNLCEVRLSCSDISHPDICWRLVKNSTTSSSFALLCLSPRTHEKEIRLEDCEVLVQYRCPCRQNGPDNHLAAAVIHCPVDRSLEERLFSLEFTPAATGAIPKDSSPHIFRAQPACIQHLSRRGPFVPPQSSPCICTHFMENKPGSNGSGWYNRWANKCLPNIKSGGQVRRKYLLNSGIWPGV